MGFSLWGRYRGRSAIVGALGVILAAAGVLAIASAGLASATQQKRHTSKRALARAAAGTGAFGELDCNGDSPIQRSLRITMACTDIRGFSNESNAHTWGGKFYDNGHYIGHDEPDMTFYSGNQGSGDNVTWTQTLPLDPTALPTVHKPGSDITHWFELTPTPWFSMAMCDGQSYPQNPCTPESDSNAPTCVGTQTTNCFPGGGSAFMEMQFYPPGFAGGDIFMDSVSCDNTHWCAAMTIDSLECTLGFASCNNNCTEPVNFAFIQTNGVPTGAPNPQEANLQTFSPDAHTLLMNPGDTLRVRMFDAPVPGQHGVKAFKVTVYDLTTGQIGYMQASAANGFQNTSIADCSGKPFNFEPEYNTASQGNVVPWAALQTNISTEFETGHFEPCSKVTDPVPLTFPAGLTDTMWSTCHGPYEKEAPGGDGAKTVEPTDQPCYPKGDTHGTLNTAPNEVTGCLDDFTQNGDLDFDGSPYWADWPTSTTPGKYPSSFVQALPSSAGDQYSQYMVQTDIALSESTCTPTSLAGCTVPPNGPGQFYPYWSRVGFGRGCTLEFGNVASGTGVNNLGQDAQYGTNQFATLGYPEFEGPVTRNTC